MLEIVGPPPNAIRNGPITPELKSLLKEAAEISGIEKIIIVSGGQTSCRDPKLQNRTGGWTGSTRHDGGRAADIELIRDGHKLSFNDTNGSQVADFITAAAAQGAIGIGAGVKYMGNRRIHVGYGRSSQDHERLVWGANGHRANAPAWLEIAAEAGWHSSSANNLVANAEFPSLGAFVVAVRDGLNLRRGAGLDFDRSKELQLGTRLTVLGFDGDWARVDTIGDGFFCGHVYAPYLRAIKDVGYQRGGGFNDLGEGEEEPLEEAAEENEPETEEASPPQTRGTRSRK